MRTIRPWPAGRISSTIRLRRRRSGSSRRLEIPNADELGTITTKRPGRETSWVSRAPFAPMGFFVTWHTIIWPGRKHLLDPQRARRLGLYVLAVVPDVAPVENRVLRGVDVDERRFHARKHVLDPPEVDVAVDLARVVRGTRHEVLDERPALEHRDLGGMRPHVDAHQVSADRFAPAFATTSATSPAGRLGKPEVAEVDLPVRLLRRGDGAVQDVATGRLVRSCGRSSSAQRLGSYGSHRAESLRRGLALRRVLSVASPCSLTRLARPCRAARSDLRRVHGRRPAVTYSGTLGG